MLVPTPAPQVRAPAWGALERGRASTGPARGSSSCARGATRADLGVGQLVVFFPLHAPILEPDLDLALRQAERVGYLHPPAPRQVAIVVKFLLQFEDLLASVGGPRALGLPAGVIGVYWTHTEREKEKVLLPPKGRRESPFFLPANFKPPGPTTSSWRAGVGKGRQTSGNTEKKNLKLLKG